MKAMVVQNYGEKAQFQLSEIAIPQIGAYDLLVSVKASSLNPVDNKILRWGLGIGPDLPAILHGDFAGIVEQTGHLVRDFKVGDHVYGMGGGVKGTQGALAEFMVVDSRLTAHKPKRLSFEEAAAIPLVAITAFEGLKDKAKMEKGDSVLVIGGTGGVGHMAIQLAQAMGGEVYASASNKEKRAILTRYQLADYYLYQEESAKEFLKRSGHPQGFDIVFDSVGGNNIEKCLDLVRNNGQLITTTSLESHDLSTFQLKALSLHVVFMLLPALTGVGKEHHQKILEQVGQWVDEGKVEPLIDSRKFTFQEINLAHQLFESNKHLGKIVLTNNLT